MGFESWKVVGEGIDGNLLGTTDPMLANTAFMIITKCPDWERMYISFLSNDSQDSDPNTSAQAFEGGQFMVMEGHQALTQCWPCPVILHHANRLERCKNRLPASRPRPPFPRPASSSISSSSSKSNPNCEQTQRWGHFSIAYYCPPTSWKYLKPKSDFLQTKNSIVKLNANQGTEVKVSKYLKTYY